jgi:hypothetical protein
VVDVDQVEWVGPVDQSRNGRIERSACVVNWQRIVLAIRIATHIANQTQLPLGWREQVAGNEWWDHLLYEDTIQQQVKSQHFGKRTALASLFTRRACSSTRYSRSSRSPPPSMKRLNSSCQTRLFCVQVGKMNVPVILRRVACCQSQNACVGRRLGDPCMCRLNHAANRAIGVNAKRTLR